MTLIQKVNETKVGKMDGTSKEDVKTLRPVRNRRYTRLVNMSHYFQSLVNNCLCASLMNRRRFITFCYNYRKHKIDLYEYSIVPFYLQYIKICFQIHRRCLVAGQRPQKRLFTPEIKRYLKDWLVRRRDNPYPNREEKKHLSRETGLTYIQVSSKLCTFKSDKAIIII